MKNKMKVNHNKKRNYIIVFGILFFSFAIVFGGYIIRKFFTKDYPLVFIDSNNKLMYITKTDVNKNDIAVIETAEIVYANKNINTLLYTNNNALYLLDTTVGGTGTKIVDNASIYGFSEDDNYIYYIDNRNTLYLYNLHTKEYINISNNVTKVELVKDNIVLYQVNNDLIYYDINTKEKEKIISGYIDVEINYDNKMILYSMKNSNNAELKDYYIYNINTKLKKEIINGVTKLYEKDSSYTKFIYTKPSDTKKDISKAIKDDNKNSDKTNKNKNDQKNIELRNQIRDYLNKYEIKTDNIYYQNGNNTTLIASNINQLYYHDIKNQRYSYTTYYFENQSIDIGSYNDIEAFYNDIETKKLNSLYYKVSTNNESMAYKNVTSKIKVNIRNGEEYYLLVNNDKYYDLYYSKISNRQVKLVGQIDSNLLSSEFNIDYIDGYLFCNYVNNHYFLNLLNDGKVRMIAEDINPKYYDVGESKDTIYYIKMTNEYVGELLLYNGIRTSKLSDDVHSFIYLNNDLIYVTKNYNELTKTSDLYRLSNNHLTLIHKNIADWYNPLDKKNIEEE